MKRNLGNLSSMGNAAAANTGSLMDTVQKDRVVYLDPVNEVYYDPSVNTRDEDVVEEDIEGLISLRLTMDSEDQLQPIRVYPLSAEQLKEIGRKPDAKVYGIGFGHRRVLACRLTSKDHPQIGDRPRKVASLIDPNWMTRGKAYRLRCQIQENSSRRDLNYVEQGQAIKAFRDSLAEEEGRHVPQREIMEIFNYKEKTLGYLMQAAEFHELAKTACNKSIITDLDTLVTFDAIAKANDVFAKAIFTSLLNKEAPRNRSLIRAAKAKLDAEPDFKVDPKTWSWPEVVESAKPKQSPPQSADGAAAPRANAPATHEGPQEGDTAPKARERDAGSPFEGEESKVVDLDFKPKGAGEPQADAHAPQAEAPESKVASKPEAAPSAGKGSEASPVILVNFKMVEEATTTFNGELVVGKAAKSPNMGIVAYLNNGKEEHIQVPLKFISLLSINH